VPQGGDFPSDPYANFTFPINNSGIQFTYTEDPFTFTVTRKGSNEVLFDSKAGRLIFSDNYLEISTTTASQYVFGLGERFAQLQVKPGNWTIMNRDRGQFLDRGTSAGNTYGHYPTYLVRTQSKLWDMSYMRASVPMAVQVESYASIAYKLTYRLIGGVFDFRFFLGNQFAEVTIERFHQILGRSAIPPFWALGMHQSRWGYQNSSMLKEVIAKYEENNLPLDTIWSDIDVLNNYISFEVGRENFTISDMAEITSKKRYVSIV
jgi:alpha-glucosidase (family GH31 glycosyl hydrolase)